MRTDMLSPDQEQYTIPYQSTRAKYYDLASQRTQSQAQNTCLTQIHKDHMIREQLEQFKYLKLSFESNLEDDQNSGSIEFDRITKIKNDKLQSMKSYVTNIDRLL